MPPREPGQDALRLTVPLSDRTDSHLLQSARPRAYFAAMPDPSGTPKTLAEAINDLRDALLEFINAFRESGDQMADWIGRHGAYRLFDWLGPRLPAWVERLPDLPSSWKILYWGVFWTYCAVVAAVLVRFFLAWLS